MLPCILAVLTSLAMSEPAPPAPKPPLKVLSGRALRTMFHGVVVIDVDDPAATAERFYADGRYSKRTRGLRQGHYGFQGDELCVSLAPENTTSCRRYARDARGEIYLVAFRDGAATPWTGASRVRVQPLTSRPG